GIYPAGGAFDDSSYASKGLDDGQGGNGITPIVANSWMHFMNAEVAVMTGGDPTSETLAGIRSNLNKVDDMIGAPAMDAASIDAYIANFAAEWTAASSLGAKLELWAEEYFVTQRGNGIDAYNSYRRNGYPQNLQPMIEPDPGQFPLSMWYPQNLAANNSNVTQKSDVSGRVFWNSNGPTVD
ncbi:SusD/RagB family nutrient-binding outer membrane lipoprotein, partial [Flavobacteriaceae bacterium]|nr:SusD/RagB family nutrient-binding outer membrane lipoprotein [Flavobacteriaceae bacterium]